MKITAECMSGLTVPAGLQWFHRVFSGQPRTTLAFLHLKTVLQNVSLETELLGLTLISLSFSFCSKYGRIEYVYDCCFPEINPDSPPSAFVVYAGLEPLQFTNLFPFWTVDERVREINLKVWTTYCLSHFTIKIVKFRTLENLL